MADKFVKVLLCIVTIVIIYYIGFGHGQAATYKKIHDDISLDDVYKYKGDVNK
jgi:hypothetical protein